MKTLIVALNSKYIHSALAPWYLKASCGDDCGEIKVKEYTINDNADSILAGIYGENADVIAFSCYIWNIGQVFAVAENLKKVAPAVKIILGGPEVSFDAEKLIKEKLFIDYIIVGEGEITFRLLLNSLVRGHGNIQGTEGIVSREAERTVSGSRYQVVEDLDSIPSPYTNDMLSLLKNRIVYFESSRGCPFSCSYCLSSTFEGVRYFSMKRVKEDLNRIIEAGAAQIKFVDRTFNCNRKRAKEIFRFIIEKGCSGLDINFHFEAAADLFDEEMLDILEGAPEGLIQFEIGVQTTNENALKAINRKTDLSVLFSNVKRLKDINNVHLHMDLIAGLPEENWDSFINSFNSVFSFRPHQLQLGFLKLLKGSQIRKMSSIYGYRFREYPPYEILFNNYMDFDQILLLKNLEEMVERYYNSNRFAYSLEYAINTLFDSAFEFFEKLSVFYKNNGYMEKPPSSRALYTILNEFIRTFNYGNRVVINELLKLDFLASDNSNNLPEGIEREASTGFKEWCFAFLKNEESIRLYLPEYQGVPAKQIYKCVHFELFNYNVTDKKTGVHYAREKNIVVFNYGKRSRVTGLYEFKQVMENQS